MAASGGMACRLSLVECFALAVGNTAAPAPAQAQVQAEELRGEVHTPAGPLQLGHRPRVAPRFAERDGGRQQMLARIRRPPTSHEHSIGEIKTAQLDATQHENK